MMDKLKKIFIDSKIFYTVILFYLLLGAVLLLKMGYKDSFLFLNQFNTTILDYPMYLLTYIGDGFIIAIICTFIIKTKNINTIVLIIISIMLSGFIAQLLKINVFSNWDRPPKVFEIHNIHILPYYILNNHAFPSGHSTTIASVFSILAYYFNKSKFQQIFFGIGLIFLAYTRVYLGVHFFGDVLAGSVLGIFCSLFLIATLGEKIDKIFVSTQENEKFCNKFHLYLKLLGITLMGVWIYLSFYK